eukprot:scaffold224_cov276-Chaetoceros_neogracile.AAC.35
MRKGFSNPKRSCKRAYVQRQKNPKVVQTRCHRFLPDVSKGMTLCFDWVDHIQLGDETAF